MSADRIALSLWHTVGFSSENGAVIDEGVGSCDPDETPHTPILTAIYVTTLEFAHCGRFFFDWTGCPGCWEKREKESFTPPHAVGMNSFKAFELNIPFGCYL